MLITLALALTVAHTAERPESCARVAGQASAVRALLAQEWWTLDIDAVAKGWPDSLERIACGSEDGTCAQLLGGEECRAVFFFTATPKGARVSLSSFSLMPGFSSLTEATTAADVLWASIPFPADACPGSLGPWGRSELTRACAWFADEAKFEIDLRIDTMDRGYNLGLSITRGSRK